MKKMILIVSSILLMCNMFADSANLKRIGDNPKILGYVVLKQPALTLEKINKSADKIMPGLSQMIKAIPIIEMAKPVLEKTEFILSIAFANETLDQEPNFISVLKATDKTVLDNIFISTIEPKLIVDNFLIYGKTEEQIKTFVDKHLEAFKNVKGQDDINLFVDIKSFITVGEKDIDANIPSFKPLLSQLDYFNLALNVSDTGIDLDTKLTPVKGSNIEVAFDQKDVPAEKLISYIGGGNYFVGLNKTIDYKKFKPLVADIATAIFAHKEVPEDAKPVIKEFQTKLNEILDVIGECSSATSAKVGEKVIQNQIVKTEKPEALVAYLKTVSVKVKEILSKINNNDIKKLNENLDIQVKEDSEENGIKIYTMSYLSEKAIKELGALSSIMPSSYYFCTVSNYFVMSTSKEELTASIALIKSGKPGKDVVLFSQQHYKADKTAYIDFDFKGYAKILKITLDAQNMGEIIPLDGLLNADIKPIAIYSTQNKNLEIGFHIDFSTISILVLEGQKVFQASMMNHQGGQGQDNDPMQQP